MIRGTTYETRLWLDTVSNKMSWITAVEADHFEVSCFHNLFNRDRRSSRWLWYTYFTLHLLVVNHLLWELPLTLTKHITMMLIELLLIPIALTDVSLRLVVLKPVLHLYRLYLLLHLMLLLGHLLELEILSKLSLVALPLQQPVDVSRSRAGSLQPRLRHHHITLTTMLHRRRMLIPSRLHRVRALRLTTAKTTTRNRPRHTGTTKNFRERRLATTPQRRIPDYLRNLTTAV
jgi:hypothetical protein